MSGLARLFKRRKAAQVKPPAPPVLTGIPVTDAELVYRYTHRGLPTPEMPPLTDADIEALRAARRQFVGWR